MPTLEKWVLFPVYPKVSSKSLLNTACAYLPTDRLAYQNLLYVLTFIELGSQCMSATEDRQEKGMHPFV